jgi:nicotinamidase-related amidase
MADKAALIVVDMLNRYEHEDADSLTVSVREVLPAMRELIAGASERDTPVIYVNDNYGDWSAGGTELCASAMEGRQRTLVEPILPPAEAAFVTKARHSTFYETSLDYLLRSQQIARVIFVGQVTEQCILYSALDAYVRHYQVAVPHDAVAHIYTELAGAALEMMERNMRAEVVSADRVLGGR